MSGDSDKKLYKPYSHSGKIGEAGWISLSLTTLLPSPGIGALYGLLLLYNPVHSISPVFTVLFSGAAGFLSGLGSDWGKVRRPWLSFWVGFAAGTLMVYIAWVVWIRATSDFTRFVFSPAAMWDIFEVLRAKGTWEILGWKPKGDFLLFLWVMEWLTASLISAAMAWGVVCRVPFCETCSRWVESGLPPVTLSPGPRFELLEKNLYQGKLADLLKLRPVEENAREYTRVELFQCPGCQQFSFLNLRQIKEISTESGVRDFEDEILENFLISPADFEALKARYYRSQEGV